MDRSVLEHARAFREGDDVALVRLVSLLVRGADPPSPDPAEREKIFRRRFFELVREGLENACPDNVARQSFQICRLCASVRPFSGWMTDDGRPRPEGVKPEITLADGWDLFTRCDACQAMRGRYPEVWNYLEHVSSFFWHLAGAPAA